MKILIILACLFIFAFCGMFAIGTCILYYSYRKTLQQKKRPKITFKAFLAFYNVNPDSWILHKDFVEKLESKNECKNINRSITVEYKCSVSLNFAQFSDYCLYVHWHNQNEKNEEQQKADKKQSANMAWVLRQVKQDIAKMEQQSYSEIQQAKDTMMEIGGKK